MKGYLLLITLFLCKVSVGQILLSEDFESGNLPDEWQIQSMATDGGWNFGSGPALSSAYFDIVSTGSTIAATNDDGCNCNKVDEYLITRPVDLSTVNAAILKFDLFYGDQTFQGDEEDARVEVSLDGSTWMLLDDLHGHGDWDEHIYNLAEYVGNETVYIGFKYDDNGGWLYGMAIDNVSIEVPLRLDASLVELNSKTFGEIGKDFKIGGTILNNGAESINTLEIQYTIDGNTPVVQVFENLDLPGFEYIPFQFDQAWVPTIEGISDVVVEILSVNGEVDEASDNNIMSFSTDILGEVIVPNNLEKIYTTIPEITTKATAGDGLDRPTDLDFFPVLGKNELWIINQRTEDIGGSTVTIAGATEEIPISIEAKVDGNAWHFMSLPTGIAFSDDNFNFANSAGVQDANHGGGTFTGPALWSSDPEIYAQPSGGNGSHLDMLHGSPFSMGIAHEVDNVFWLYDDWNSDIVRYDFAEDHGPGNDDHSDGSLRRYGNIGIQRDSDIPNHLILDKETGWLYFVDNGNDRVMRLDINSGSIAAPLDLINEPLAEHVAMGGFTVELVVDQGLERPCGIEFFEGSLLVGDYATGAINVYDTTNDFELMGVIETQNDGLTGIKIGPDGNIYAVNRIDNTLVVISEGLESSVQDYEIDNAMTIFPNPSSDVITIAIDDKNISDAASVTIFNSLGQIVLRQSNMDVSTIDVSTFAKGSYTIEVRQSEKLYKKQFTVIR